jgi:DNA-binding IclR family transcriptional regulator
VKQSLKYETHENAITMTDERYVINSVVRAARILESFTVETPSLSNAELAKKLGINKSAITRLMQSLVKAKFVTRDKGTGRYQLTHKLFKIGNVYVKNSSLHSEGLPLLKKLSKSFNENAQIGILDKTEVMYLEQIKCSQHIGLMSTRGSRLPAYCTGAGKVILAYLTADRLDEFYRNVDFVSFTPNTATDPEALNEQLEKIRNEGVALVRSEFRDDVISVAAPVYGNEGEVIAAISLAGPVYRMDFPDKIEKYKRSVMDTAKNLSDRI